MSHVYLHAHSYQTAYTCMIEMSYRNYKMQMKGKSLRWHQ